jgi:hypothetical protein
MDTYEALIKYFYLKKWQIKKLMASPFYEEIMAAKRDGDFNLARGLLIEEGIIFF